MEPLLPIRRRASQHPRRANRSPRGTRPSCKLTARPCAASQKAATTPLTNHKKNPQPRFNRNQQYSITAVSDGGGSVVERYAYSAYGQVTFADASGSEISDSAIANRYTYTGREWDEGLSLYHYRARIYDAVVGKFVSRDPIGFSGGYNLYLLYVALDRVDPTGNQPENVQPGKCSRTDCRVTTDLQANFAWDENERKRRGPWEFQIQTEGNCPRSFSAEGLSRIFQNWGGSKNQVWNELQKSECNRIGKTKNDKACGPCHFCRIDNLTSYTTRSHQVNFLTTRLAFAFHWREDQPNSRLYTSQTPFRASNGPCTISISGRFPITILYTHLEGHCVRDQPIATLPDPEGTRLVWPYDPDTIEPDELSIR